MSAGQAVRLEKGRIIQNRPHDRDPRLRVERLENDVQPLLGQAPRATA